MTTDGSDPTRRTVIGGLAGLTATGALAGYGAATQEGGNGNETGGDGGDDRNGLNIGIGLDVEVTQEEGRAVNWVLPGKRRLSEEVFGTPENPMMGDDLIEHVKTQMPEMADLLEELPFPVGVPEEMRETNEDGTRFTTTSVPTAFGDAHEPTSGRLALTYEDRQPNPGVPTAQDGIEFDVEFDDPAENTYTIEIDHLEERMFGGVLAGGIIHGTTGIGSPLMTRLYNYGSFWGVGTLTMNGGERTWENREVHFMTTQMVRDANYALALDEEMPLENPYLEGKHHTHGILPPIEVTEEGPSFSPLDIPFPPDEEQGQPFIHIMYDEDEVSMQTAE